ncbi:hypothetical protein TEA_017500 [Camellia sinensis var. sinensis]|uniref:WAT1-related protein n=1 Tax=Camellia sinensis var. sinensis TaxID=542762 RepID=A0A4S4DDU9_CAMSN|nr:hypothetical protein TEA_017500 [Camellia sinensis var. sinensis]
MKMEGKKPYLAVILIQAIYAGMFLLSKAAFDVGMNTFVFVFYRQAAATVFLAPLAMFFEWKNAPAISGMTLFKIFMLSFFGITLSLNVYGVALIYTSASLAAATTNSLPVITFFIAVLLRMEMVKLRTTHGIAKIAGVAICLGGAAIIALYRGPSLKLLLHHHLFEVHHKYSSTQDDQVPSTKTWIKGCFLMLMSNTFWGLWLVLQSLVPGRLGTCGHESILVVMSANLRSWVLLGRCSIQSLIIAIALERDPRQWKLQWNVRLVAVAYCGIVVTGVTYYLQTWVIEKKGPVFLAMSTPLALVFTILCSAILLGEIVTLGSVLGSILLVGGLYSVLWGNL